MICAVLRVETNLSIDDDIYATKTQEENKILTDYNLEVDDKEFINTTPVQNFWEILSFEASFGVLMVVFGPCTVHKIGNCLKGSKIMYQGPFFWNIQRSKI